MVRMSMIWGEGAFSGKGWKVTPLRPHIAVEEQGEYNLSCSLIEKALSHKPKH